MMNKHISYITALILLFGSVSYAGIRVIGPDELEAYSYSFPQEALHKNITNLGFIYKRDVLRDPPNEYKASLYISPKECTEKTAYIGLEKMELLAKDSTGKEVILPIIIKGVSMDEHHTLAVDFKYKIEAKLTRSAKLKIYLDVKEEKEICYILNFRDLKNAK